ncbi:serine/threonine-protein kinase [Dactylosporangium sp. CA-092794]|uniref:serine/threonine-protein kinase n=1 Tax=Dactylosporangium sp. CA-092794 TaxID=3239929 RepID=UPI003D8D8C5B
MRTPPEARYDTDGHHSGDLTGYRIGDSYELVEPIGGGGTGTVWRARALNNDEHVAVKLLREDLMAEPKAVNRFVQERAILLMLRHPHIVRVRDLVTVGTSLGLVMDLVEGGSLRDHLHEQGTLPPAEAATLLAQVAEALSAAHRRGIVHRDLKPDNILLDRVDGELHTRLTDFGIARVLDTPSMTTPGALVGTANYVAPEAVYGNSPTPAADIYALGVVLYELTTGRPTYAGGPAWAILRRHVDESPRRAPGMPDAVWEVVEACMDKRPGRRPTARDLAVALRTVARRTRDEPALPPLPVDERLTTLQPPVPLPRSSSHSRGVFLAVVLVVLALLAVPAWLYATRERSADTSAGASAAPAPAAPAPAPSAARSAAAGGAASRSPGTLRVGDKSAGPSAEPGVHVEGSVVFGPWLCGDQYTWDLGHPVLAQPCHAVGGDLVRMVGHMQGLPGVQADVSLSVLDVESNAVADGPHLCTGQMFTDFAPEHDCGPFEARLPHGHRYVVVEKWLYTGRALLPGGQVRGQEFDW